MGINADSWIDIDAPIDAVFAVVADVELVPQWQPDVTVLECLQRDKKGRATLIHAELSTPIRTTRAFLRITHEEPTVVSWDLEKGDVRAFHGKWTLEKLAKGRTRAQYETTIDFGGKLGVLMRGPATKALQGVAVSSMPGKLKAFVEEQPAAPQRKSA